jgi:hypothetical protein
VPRNLADRREWLGPRSTDQPNVLPERDLKLNFRTMHAQIHGSRKWGHIVGMPLQFFAEVGKAALRLEPLGSAEIDPAMPHHVVRKAAIEFGIDVAAMEPYFRTEEWRREFDHVETQTLTEMFCGIVSVENELDIYTCTTPTAPAYRLLCDRLDSRAAEELLDWALRRRGRNDYTPIGRATSARSADEYYYRRAIKEACRAVAAAEQEELAAAGVMRRAERAALAADHAKRSEANRIGRQARLDQLAKKDHLSRLKYLSLQDECPLGSLPVDIFQNALEAISRLPDAELTALATRLDQHRGLKEWREIRHIVDTQVKHRTNGDAGRLL